MPTISELMTFSGRKHSTKKILHQIFNFLQNSGQSSKISKHFKTENMYFTNFVVQIGVIFQKQRIRRGYFERYGLRRL